MSIDWTDRLYYSGVTFLLVAVLALVFYVIVSRADMSQRQLHRLRYRIIYIAMVVVGVVLVRVWVENFTHLFTMLGLVAAGLVVANKETIMNFTGWFVINWRNLFAEGDHIALLTYVGYVDQLGPLYFKIYEVDMESNCLTGRTIRIPNGLVINNSVANYSSSNLLLQASLTVPVVLGGDLMAVQEVIGEVLHGVLLERYRKLPLPEAMIWKRYHKNLAHLVSEDPIIRWQPQLDKKTVNVVIYFYCLSMDQVQIKNLFWQKLLLRSHENEILKHALGGSDK